MDLDLRLVRAFMTVVEEGHVGRAAQRLYVTQPALSKQLRRLEETLGAALFTRAGRSLRPTTAGESFYADAQRLCALAAEAAHRTRLMARATADRTVVAFAAGLIDVAAALLRTAHRRRPDLNVQLLRVDWHDQADCLRQGRADLALVRPPIDRRNLQHQMLITEPRVAGFARQHPLAARATVSIRELDHEPIVATAHQQDYWTINPRPSGAAPILGPTANTVEEMLAVVAAGECMCITAASLARAYPRSDLRWVHIPDVSPGMVALAWPAGTPDGRVHDIASLAQEVVEEMISTSLHPSPAAPEA